jgi:hypothetical protein
MKDSPGPPVGVSRSLLRDGTSFEGAIVEAVGPTACLGAGISTAVSVTGDIEECLQ